MFVLHVRSDQMSVDLEQNSDHLICEASWLSNDIQCRMMACAIS
jgi:hypothetical protein